MRLRSICLMIEGGFMNMVSGPESVTCTTPADFWRAIHTIGGEALAFHLCAPGQVPQAEGVHRAALLLAEGCAVAALGAVCGPNGDVTAPLAASSASYAPVAKGSVIVSALALQDLTWGRGVWDDFWQNDLVTALHQRGAILCLGDVIAAGGPMPSQGLLPFARAGHGHADGAPTVIVLSAPDATCALYFDRFRAAPGLDLRILPPLFAGGALVWLCHAAAIVISREVAGLIEEGKLALLRELGIPVFWFLDDDVFALGAEYAAFAPYLSETFRPLQNGISGIVAATPALAAALQERMRLPRPPCVLPPALALDLAKPKEPPAYVAAVIGGAFRGASLRDQVLPALRLAAPEFTLAAHDNLRPFLNGSDVRFLPFEGDFYRFLHLWQALRPAILIHPAGESSNMPNKSDATVLIAHALGAVPVVADEPAFLGWDESMGVVVVADNGWENALRRVTKPDYAALLRLRLKDEIERRQRELPDLLDVIGNPAAVCDVQRDRRLQYVFDLPQARPAAPARRSLWARLRRSLWKRGLWPGDQVPKIAAR